MTTVRKNMSERPTRARLGSNPATSFSQSTLLTHVPYLKYVLAEFGARRIFFQVVPTSIRRRKESKGLPL